MKIALTLLLLLAGCSPQPQPSAPPPTPAVQASPTVPPVAGPPEEAKAQAKAVGPVEPLRAPKKEAVVVGINKYGGGNDLAGCVNDARAWAALLEAKGYEVHLLLDADATAANIRQECKLLKMARVPGDKIAFVDSSHGTQYEDPSEPDGLMEALCPVDCMTDWPNTLISAKEMRRWLTDVPDGVEVTIIGDLCHSGVDVRGLAKSKRKYLAPPKPVAAGRKVSKAGVWPTRDARPLLAFWAGCSESGTCADTEVNGVACGAFSYAIHKAMKDAPAAKLSDASAKVAEWLRVNGYEQVPVLTAPAVRLGEAMFR